MQLPHHVSTFDCQKSRYPILRQHLVWPHVTLTQWKLFYIYIFTQVLSFHTFSHHRLVRCVNIPSSNAFIVSSQTVDSYLLHETLLRNSPSIRWAQWQLVLQMGSTSNMSGQWLCTSVLFFSYVRHIRQSHPEMYKWNDSTGLIFHQPSASEASCQWLFNIYTSHQCFHAKTGTYVLIRVSKLLEYLTLNTKALRSFKTSVTVYQFDMG